MVAARGVPVAGVREMKVAVSAREEAATKAARATAIRDSRKEGKFISVDEKRNTAWGAEGGRRTMDLPP